MASHMSAEMCERMAIWHSELGQSSAEIPELVNCSKPTIQEIFRLH